MTSAEASRGLPDGMFCYSLSDHRFIDIGWTVLPVQKIVRKMNIYRMRPSQPEFNWFERNKMKRHLTYDTGEDLAIFEQSGRCRWYYRNGRLALDYYEATETNAQQRIVVYSNGEPDERGRSRPYTVLATFDYKGNGVVFDHSGKIRLKYTQTEGVILDRSIGPMSTWQWHSLNDPPVLRQVMINTQLTHKDPDIYKLEDQINDKSKKEVVNSEILAIEFENSIKEQKRKLSQEYKPYQIKMKALKINDNFSLKVLDQATIYLIFREGSANIKLNIGMILDHREIIDTDTADVGEVPNSLECYPACTESVAELQHTIANAKHFEKKRVAKERSLQQPPPVNSVDRLVAGLSRPLKPPLRTFPIHEAASKSSAQCCRNSRKPCLNLYYNSRLP